MQYQTAGTATAGGLDRGTLLTEMDAELLSIMKPQQIQKTDYSVTPPSARARVLDRSGLRTGGT